MICSFCQSPAAHPATGCQYGPNTLACASCVRECWRWVRQHTNAKARRRGRGPATAQTFYEAAGSKVPASPEASIREVFLRAMRTGRRLDSVGH